MPLSGALKRLRIPKPGLLIAVILPMVMDAVLNDTGIHSSTTMTRLATGLVFGGVMPWCIVPLFIEASLQLIQKKKNPSPDTGVRMHV